MMTAINQLIGISSSLNKNAIRLQVWDYMHHHQIAFQPHNRIPNFRNSDIACDKLLLLEEFPRANLVKVNPDKPQSKARFHVLNSRKTLLVPTPRLSHGLFNRIRPPNYDVNTLQVCSTSRGVKEFSDPVSLDENISIDMIVVGSVAVSKQGYRIGKGEGFADLEFGMLCELGAYVPGKTVVISIVDDCQVFDKLDDKMFSPHDFLIDIILTPNQIIYCDKPKERDTPGILWSLLTEQRLKDMPILRVFKQLNGCEERNI